MMQPRVMIWINPNLAEDYNKIHRKNVDPEEAARLTNLINTGYEGYTHVREEDLEKVVNSYIAEQEKIQSRFKK